MKIWKIPTITYASSLLYMVGLVVCKSWVWGSDSHSNTPVTAIKNGAAELPASGTPPAPLPFRLSETWENNFIPETAWCFYFIKLFYSVYSVVSCRFYDWLPLFDFCSFPGLNFRLCCKWCFSFRTVRYQSSKWINKRKLPWNISWPPFPFNIQL